MPKLVPTNGYPTLADYVEAKHAEGWTDRRMAKDTGLTPVQIRASLSSRLRTREIALMDRKMTLPVKTYRAIEAAAIVRGIPPRELAMQLLDVIAEDDAFDVLLGEPGSCHDV